MKKKILVGALITVLGVGSLVGYAETVKIPNILPNYGVPRFEVENPEEHFKEMLEFRKDEIKRALERGLITKEEAKYMEENLKYMENYQKEYGFVPGGCGMGMGFGRGMRRGIMGGGHRIMRGNWY